ncbi:MAG: DEAD/DEAH box helicase [Candidatus Hodarchaeales archaeon]|jgi:helicase
MSEDDSLNGKTEKSRFLSSEIEGVLESNARMKMEDLDLPPAAKKLLETRDGIKELYPPQAEAIEQGLLSGDTPSMLVAIPTASGKTLIAELATIKHVLDLQGKVIYLCPLRALASEKYEDFKRFSRLGIKVTMTSGDYDSEDRMLDIYDVIVSTNEKLDALLRHRVDLVRDSITLVILDECHIIDDFSRGPTLETLIVKIRRLNPKIQLLGLSATIPNADEIARWMGALMVSSEWRPVPLKKRTVTKNKIYNDDNTIDDFKSEGYSDLVQNLVHETLSEEKGQTLCFSNTRRNAAALARRLSAVTEKTLTRKEISILNEAAAELTIDGRSDPTSVQLATLVKKGAAYHHAGLDRHQRKIIEESYKKNLIKALTATPTLAAGVNLPARRVIISSSWRYSTRSVGRENLKIAEIHQMMGRAGRPKYDSEGDALLVAKTDAEAKKLLQKYVQGIPEPVTSKLAVGPTLRSIVLGLLTGKLATDFDGIMSFMNETLFGYQIGASFLEENVSTILDFLKVAGMIEVTPNKYMSTRYGTRVSQLYLDPLSADVLRKGIERAIQRSSPVNDFSWLQLISSTPDLTSLNLKLGRHEYTGVQSLLEECKDELLVEIPDLWSSKFEFLLQQLKTAKLLEAWIEEKELVEILANFRTTGGDINRLLETAKWICYAAGSIARIVVQERPQDRSQANQTLKYLYETELRLAQGIKNELIPLCSIRGIGRVRARVLFDGGYRSPGELKKSPVDKLVELKGFGTELVRSIMKELGRDVSDELPVSSNKEREKLPSTLDSYFS